MACSCSLKVVYLRLCLGIVLLRDTLCQACRDLFQTITWAEPLHRTKMPIIVAINETSTWVSWLNSNLPGMCTWPCFICQCGAFMDDVAFCCDKTWTRINFIAWQPCVFSPFVLAQWPYWSHWNEWEGFFLYSSLRLSAAPLTSVSPLCLLSVCLEGE